MIFTNATLNSRIPEIVALIDVATDARVKGLAEEVAELAAQNVHRGTGAGEHLADHIHVIPIDDNTYSVQAGDEEVWWGHLEEYGTMASKDRPFSTPAHPFLIPAFEEIAESVGKVQFDL
jgi:hypothetical protein